MKKSTGMFDSAVDSFPKLVGASPGDERAWLRRALALVCGLLIALLLTNLFVFRLKLAPRADTDAIGKIQSTAFNLSEVLQRSEMADQSYAADAAQTRVELAYNTYLNGVGDLASSKPNAEVGAALRRAEGFMASVYKAQENLRAATTDEARRLIEGEWRADAKNAVIELRSVTSSLNSIPVEEAESLNRRRQLADLAGLCLALLAFALTFSLSGWRQEMDTVAQKKTPAEQTATQALHVARDAIIALDTGMAIVSLNPAAERLFGYRLPALIGKPLSFLIPSIQQKQPAELRAHTTSETAARRDSSSINVELSIHATRNSGARGWIAVVREVSVEPRPVAAAKAPAKEPEPAPRSLPADRVGELASGMLSHLTVINGYGDLLLDSVPPSESVHADLDDMRRAGARAEAIACELLASTSANPPLREETDLQAVVAELEPQLSLMTFADLEFHFRRSSTACPVRSDRDDIRQLVIGMLLYQLDRSSDQDAGIFVTVDATTSAATLTVSTLPSQDLAGFTRWDSRNGQHPADMKRFAELAARNDAAYYYCEGATSRAGRVVFPLFQAATRPVSQAS